MPVKTDLQMRWPSVNRTPKSQTKELTHDVNKPKARVMTRSYSRDYTTQQTVRHQTNWRRYCQRTTSMLQPEGKNFYQRCLRLIHSDARPRGLAVLSIQRIWADSFRIRIYYQSQNHFNVNNSLNFLSNSQDTKCLRHCRDELYKYRRLNNQEVRISQSLMN